MRVKPSLIKPTDTGPIVKPDDSGPVLSEGTTIITNEGHTP
jgi:hypothetical protein